MPATISGAGREPFARARVLSHVPSSRRTFHVTILTALWAAACGDPASGDTATSFGTTDAMMDGGGPTAGEASSDGSGGPVTTMGTTAMTVGSDTTATGTADDSGGGDGSTGPGNAADFDTLCASPGVIFCDDFEDGPDPAWIEDGGDVRLQPDAAVSGVGAQVVELATYAGQQSSKLIYVFPDVDEIYIRFDVRYDPTYDNTGGSHGPVLSGSMAPPWGAFGTAGIQPAGDDWFVLNYEPNGIVGDGGTFHFYAYFVNMLPDGHGDFWGNYFDSTMQPPPVIVPGQWQCVEYGMTLNDPAGDDGLADFWVEGVHHGHFDGFIWRTVPELHINTFSLDSYNHFNDGPLPPESPNLVRYDNVIVSTAPVGCLAG
ncbi:MAG: hypothetical protein IPH07_17165 [Deltaproteobacteria bacterium]|nr:hypothetical protein [Deltaproteobacteria bacterium]MBP7289992.1 hypothetical protein [Nannocystaceae bacterium]